MEIGAENRECITLDDQTRFEIAQADPVGFIRNLPPKRIALDEVQRLPELFVSIKQAVGDCFRLKSKQQRHEFFRP